MKERIGSLYRIQIIKHFNLNNINGKVLDIGCHNGFILSQIDAQLKIGIDLELPKHKHRHINYVCADVNHLPFKKEAFDKILLLDVIEHIFEDVLVPESIYRVLVQNGSFFLSTPSDQIKLFPSILTKPISRKWGHIFRLGYSIERLRELFSKHFIFNICEWNANYWRVLYLPIRLISIFSTKITNWLIIKVFLFDKESTFGSNGYYITTGIKNDQKK